MRIVTAGELAVFVNDTETGSEDTDQGSRSLFFFPLCTLKVKNRSFHIENHSSPVETRSTLKAKCTKKEMVLHGSRLYPTFQNAGDLWVLHSAGTQINMLSCCTHAPNMMKEKRRGNQFISTLNMGQGPGQRHRV